MRVAHGSNAFPFYVNFVLLSSLTLHMRGLIFRVSSLFMILLFVGYYNGDCEVLYVVGRLMFNSDVATNKERYSCRFPNKMPHSNVQMLWSLLSCAMTAMVRWWWSQDGDRSPMGCGTP